MPHPAPSRPLLAILIGIAVAAVAGPAWVVTHPPKIVHVHKQVALVHRVVPATEVPNVEPVAYEALTPDEARTYNADVPYITGPNPAARPFRLSAMGDDRTRAIDCLATAVLYEAGDDPPGEKAVAQVVLNRVRHPAFPKTVCGVVFQGSERSTGCQFTFTCDGSMARRPNPQAWDRAKFIATQAIDGAVYKPVGLATHYHTDWVVPYWQASLDKLAAVHTQLFYRWSGWWGTLPAFRLSPLAAEPVIPAMAALSPAHMIGQAQEMIATAQGQLAAGSLPEPADPNTFLVSLPSAVPPAGWAAFAEKACGDRPYCKLFGWAGKARPPASLPLPPSATATLAFSYLRDRANGFEKPLWNCALNPRPSKRECMKLSAPLPEPKPAAEAAAPPPITATVKPPQTSPAAKP